MNHLRLAALLVAALPLCAFAQEAFDPASIMPADTVLYGEFDAQASVRGFLASDIVRILYAEEFKSFFGPLRAEIPGTPEEIAKPLLDYVKGHAAVGVSAVSLRLLRFDGKFDTVRIAPGAPVNADMVRKLLRTTIVPGFGAKIILDIEGVAVLDPGPETRKALDAFLKNPPVPCKQKIVQRGERQILEIEFEAFETDREGPWMAPHFHIDMTGDRWIIATSPELLAAATQDARRTSLATDAQFVAQRKRHTSGERGAFFYADIAKLWKVAKPVLPPAGFDFLDEEAIGSVRALSIGMSFVEGGVRESYGIALTEQPQGFWRMLDAMPPGLKSIDKAPARAKGTIALKFDGKIFMQRMEEWFGRLMPGVESQIRGFWTQAALEVGIDLDREILDALGDEIALILFPPGAAGLPIPDLALAVDVRNDEAFRGLLAKLRVLLSRTGVVRLDTKKFRDETEGWQLFWTAPMNAPQFRMHKGHFVGSTNPLVLRHWLADWDAPKTTLRKDGEVFQKVMRGLNGGDVDSLCALVYGDIQSYLPILVAFAAGMGALDEDMFKTKPMPDLKKMASMTSGFALGMRRDKQGVAIDVFSPNGLTSLFVGAAIFFVRDVEAIAVPVPVR